MSLSGYEERPLLDAPGLAAQQHDPGHQGPLDMQSIGDRPELLPGGWKSGAGFDRRPLRGAHAGQAGRLLDGKARFLAAALDEPAEETAPGSLC